MAGASYRPDLPFVLGHEPVGVVSAAGEAVTDRWLGRRVTMTLFTGCGQCSMCQHGDERLCPELESITGVLGALGGYAPVLRIHASQAVEAPSALSDLGVASLVDSGATAANAVGVARQFDQSNVVIVGAGPIGLIAAELLRYEGIVPRVVQSSEPRRGEVARRGFQVSESLEGLNEPASIVIDCAGTPEATVRSIEALAPKGCYIAAGYARVPNFDLPSVARKELTVRGVRSGSRDDLIRVLDLASTGRIELPPVQAWPLAQINEALQSLREHQVTGKAVVVLPE
jgi:2-desacetyl-2-hydroxyethyl bacteriochlorophyllide A dehydrogenase